MVLIISVRSEPQVIHLIKVPQPKMPPREKYNKKKSSPTKLLLKRLTNNTVRKVQPNRLNKKADFSRILQPPKTFFEFENLINLNIFTLKRKIYPIINEGEFKQPRFTKKCRHNAITIRIPVNNTPGISQKTPKYTLHINLRKGKNIVFGPS